MLRSVFFYLDQRSEPLLLVLSFGLLFFVGLVDLLTGGEICMTFFYLFGYPAGDRLLCSIARAFRDNVALPDLVGRLGGTAFFVLLPDTASDAASLTLDRIRKKLRRKGSSTRSRSLFTSAPLRTRARSERLPRLCWKPSVA